MINILRLNRNDTVIVVNVNIGVSEACSLVLLLNLSLRVQNYVQVLSLLNGHSKLLLKSGAVEPSVQHWQLVFPSCFIPGFQESLIFRCYFHECADGVGEVLNEQVLAEWCIAILEAALVLHSEVKVIDALCEGLLVEVDEEGARCSFELLEAEWVDHDLDGFLHIYI